MPAPRTAVLTPLLRAPLLLAVVLLALTASQAPPRAEAEAAGARFPGLRVFASAHYHIHTDLPRAAVVPIGRHMDAIHEQYTQRFAAFKTRDRAPMPLYLFRTKATYHAFLAAHDLASDHSGGMFFVTPRVSGLATWVEGNSRSRTLSVLQHEGFHQFAWRHLGPGLPVWVNEGLAQYFEDAILIDGRLALGLANAGRVQRVREALEADEALKLSALFALTPERWGNTLREEPDRADLLYAQAWSVAYFLIHADDGRYRRAFGRYLELLAGQHDPEHAFATAFGVATLDGMERAWRRFAQQQEPDPVSTAAQRLEFIGTALRYLHENRQPSPRSIAALRDHLRSRGFSVSRTSHGVSQTLNAADEKLFTFTRPGGATAPFVMLEASRDDLPPRVTAPGLRPEPTLVWSRDDNGQLVQDLTYR
ncbi:MAG: DUF1570 domain-containing protein [Planctomycetes bacterium]|jgi:hypothetical protein|nr:DUF1570 domain-containing protein [Planctomycetota bacterium]